MNAFEQIAIDNAKMLKKHERRVATIKQQKEENDQQTQFRLYRKANRVEINKLLLSNPAAYDLMKMLKSLAPDSAPALVDYTKNLKWLETATIETKQTVLSMIDDAIIRVRVTHGLPPFDDSLGDEPRTAFQLIRKHLMKV